VKKLEVKRFTKIDESFTCAHCGFEVKPLGVTCRNHCPRCLWSMHVDNLPGDRRNECGGLMEPIACETDAKRGYVIVHRCTKCGAVKRNKAADKAREQPDDIDKLIALTVNGGTLRF
jgi:DNA-directed RNA polymerase subunit RPC12/RpoP